MASIFQRQISKYYKYKIAIFAHVCLLAMFRFTAGQQNCQKSESIPNYVLVGHVHKVISRKKPLTCVFACHEEPNCYSVNFHSGARTCELSLQTRGSHPRNFVHRNEWLYMEMLRQPPKAPPRTLCDHVTCKNGGTCLNRKSGYVCVCKKDFWGSVCEHCKSLALGMENRSIPDSSIAASAYSRGFAPRNARLNNPTSCWKLKINGSYTGEISLTIQLNQITMVTRISTQGDPKEASWVTQFWLQYLDSSSQRKRFYGKDNKLMMFSGNSDSNTTVSQWIDPPIVTQRLIIRPFRAINTYAMRVELYGCRI